VQRTWLTLRLDGDVSEAAAHMADEVDVDGAKHTVVQAHPVELPPDVWEKLADALEGAQAVLKPALTRAMHRHAAAIFDRPAQGGGAAGEAALEGQASFQKRPGG
jgi:hypothetical protein